jgi:hypothetical protein
LLRSKGVDHSDEALAQYIEETTQRIGQDLQSIANFSTTDEALSEIKNFVEAGLKIVQEIVNDPNPERSSFQRMELPLMTMLMKPKMIIKVKLECLSLLGNRIKGTVLVKADVITQQQTSGNPQFSNSENLESQGGVQEPPSTGNDDSKVEQTGNPSDVPLTGSVFPGSSQESLEGSFENLAPNELEKSSRASEADITTHELESISPTQQQTSGDSQPSNPENLESQGGVQKLLSTGNKDSKVEETGSTNNSIPGQDESNSTEPQSSGSYRESGEANCESLVPNELEKPSETFKGKITYQGKLMRQPPKLAFRNRPQKEAKTDVEVGYDQILDFEGWIVGGSWNEGSGKNKKEDNRWYKVAGQDLWLPAIYVEVEGGLQSSLQLTNGAGDADEAQ